MVLKCSNRFNNAKVLVLLGLSFFMFDVCGCVKRMDWNQWIKFFLKCAAEQTKKNIKFIEEVNIEDLQKVKAIIHAHSASAIVNSFF
jgi:hypothetical protein